LDFEDDDVEIPEAEKKIFEKDHGKGVGYRLFSIKKGVYGRGIQETGRHGIEV
jgi:hypothetical protein